MFRQFGAQELLVLLLLVVPFVLLVTLIVAMVRRSSRRKRTTTPTPVGPAPSGWYQNPDDVSQLRYWDGSQWTDRTASQDDA